MDNFGRKEIPVRGTTRRAKSLPLGADHCPGKGNPDDWPTQTCRRSAIWCFGKKAELVDWKWSTDRPVVLVPLVILEWWLIENHPKTIGNRVACETPDALGWCVHCWTPLSWPTCQIAGSYRVFDGHHTRSNSNWRSNTFQNHTEQRVCLRPSGRASWPSSMSDFKTTTTWSNIYRPWWQTCC